MKRNGNTAVNQAYNPKNRRPDMPLDADEIDSAMERFIRKKYQDRSLNDPNRPAIRNEGSPPVPPKSPIDDSPPLPAPSKKSRFFGFGLRASSSAYPLSKHDKKKLPPEPRVESAFTISSDDYPSVSRMSDANAPISGAELQRKLVQLKDMGFSDTDRNTSMLRRMNGNVERTVEALIQLGPSVGKRTSSAAKVDTQPTGSSKAPSEPPRPAPSSVTSSNNPFDQPTRTQGFGLSVAPVQQAQSAGQSTNPFDQPTRSQTDTGLAASFQGLQLSQSQPQPLFPHSTGGYPAQNPLMIDPRLQTMTPPAPMLSQQYGYVASPPAVVGGTNPFFQPVQPQVTGSNPFFQQQQFQQQQLQPTTSNPFMATNAAAQQSNSVSLASNPFGLPPSKGSSPPQSSQSQANQMTGLGLNQAPQSATAAFPPSNPFLQQPQQLAQPQISPQFPNFQYGQPQMQLQQPEPPIQSPTQYQGLSNPYASFMQPQQHFQQQPAPLMPQQTGKYDKNSIMALYNYPQLAPTQSQGLTSIPEPTNEAAQSSASMMGQPRRSSTMPLAMSSMHSAGGAGNAALNRNPFLQNSQQMPVQGQGIMSHSSRDSVNINNLDNGRHSPDAFANLSARYGN
jgi:hypothetical protein